ncbi:unnamed protein product [Triticum turgidum subsp. durum]|uniref:U-box domain-containing protein n=1 Tax=Triticum turgidum subsp. durum TaxID=4567 RepID=A0A9R1QRW8_TRITD|nr:unnamed protein product [Triticum turgidum subsp. durum]
MVPPTATPAEVPSYFLCPISLQLMRDPVGALRKLGELVAECEDTRAMLESQDGVFDALSRVLTGASACSTAREEAVGVLASLRIPEQELVRIVSRHGNLAESLTAVLRSSNLQSRAQAVRLLCGVKTKEKAHEVLKLHSRIWRSSPCLSPKFLALYPS